jgi:N-glycosylase/DNA lyase
MVVPKIAIGGKLQELIEEHADDQYCQEILLFLGRHPHTRFSRLTIIHALNGYRWCTEQALSRLTDDGVVKRYIENDVTLYSLGVVR